MAAMGGQVVSQTVEGRERYNVLVRYARDYRDNVEALERVLVPTPTGAQIPIAQVADIAFRTGPPAVRSEDGLLGGFVFVDVKAISALRTMSNRRSSAGRRIAAPMVGGVISALVMVLMVSPAIFAIWRGRGLEKRPTAGHAQPPPA